MFDKIESSMIENMERALLSTIIFDNDSILLIVDNIFTNQEYKNIFDTMNKLYQKKYPINESNIISILGSQYESALVEILSTNPITHIKHIYNTLVENSHNVYIQNQLKKIVTNDNSSIDKIQELESLLQRSKDFKRQEIFNLIDFTTVEEKTPIFYLEDILPIQEHEINIISAPGGSGKSYISLYLALEFIHKYTLKKCFLWLSEDEIGVSKKRAISLCKIHSHLKVNNQITVIGKETQVFHFIDKNLKVHDKFELMKKQLQDFEFIILDPLIAFFGADENSNADARYFMSVLNKWCVDSNKTIILIHHHTKATIINKSNARGASAFIDACRMHYVVEKIDNDTQNRKLVIDKTNHFVNDKQEYIIKLFESKYNKSIQKNIKKHNQLKLLDIDITEVKEL